MRYAIMSDIHGNDAALDAVLRDIEARPGVDGVYHLGDLVGYGPSPNEVVARLLDASIPGVAGNYDSTVATDYQHCGCRYEDPHQEELAHVSYGWTRAHVSADTRRFLKALPFRIDLRPLGGHAAGPTVSLVHGNQVLNTVYVYQERSDDFLTKMGSSMGLRSGDTVCFGHTHKPWHRVVGGVHFVNAGSVGKPKDGDWRACYALLDLDGNTITVEFIRVAYPVDNVASAIRASDLPDEFADQLRTGGTTAASLND